MDTEMVNQFASQLWKDFKPYLDKMFNQRNITSGELMNAYTLIYNGTTPSRRLGSRFYKNLYWYLVLRCSDIVLQAKGTNKNDLLEFYRDECANFRWSSNRLRVACSYLGITWIKNQYDYIRFERSGKKIYDLEQLPLILWGRMVYDKFPLSITFLLIEQIREERSGASINKQLMSDVIRSYVELGLEDDDGKLHLKASMDFYITEFEDYFLQDTEDFYEEEKAEYLRANNAVGFQQNMRYRELEEMERIQQYLHQESFGKVLAILEKFRTEDNA